MTRLRLTIACGDYDRTRGLADGSVRPEGIDVDYVALDPGELFERVARHREFPVAEMSLGTYINLLARGDDGLVGIPVYPSRSFRHSSIYVNRAAGITRPEDLRGKRVGTMQYQLTLNVWLRGILEEDHGVRPSDFTWVFGGQDVPGTRERAPVDIPADVTVEMAPRGSTLGQLLVDGQIDALFAPHTPDVFHERRPEVGRLFENYRAVESAWYRRTKLFPIMHLVVIRRDVYESDRWVAKSLFKAFCEDKSRAMARLHFTGTLAAMVPWLVEGFEDAQDLFGERYWPYGVEANRAELETALRWAHAHGVARRPVTVEQLFAPETLDAVDGG
jgi:4,5-dihydroxyphthalate decarboxylase